MFLILAGIFWLVTTTITSTHYVVIASVNCELVILN